MFLNLTAMFTISYLAPYTGEVRTQSFATLAEAQRMIDFYQSCGTKASLV